eukprot:Skav221081  [mRNA]  locus=scaffold3118:494664:495065:+ [translate_table: standard]
MVTVNDVLDILFQLQNQCCHRGQTHAGRDEHPSQPGKIESPAPHILCHQLRISEETRNPCAFNEIGPRCWANLLWPVVFLPHLLFSAFWCPGIQNQISSMRGHAVTSLESRMALVQRLQGNCISHILDAGYIS